MPNVARTLEDTIQFYANRLGQWWPNDWWPGQDNDANDCAAFMSAGLYGMNKYGGPVFTYVSQLQNNTAYGQRFFSKSGIRRGDLMGFSWGMNNDYDHTEMALNSPDANGNFLTIGTNAGPTDRVAVRTRNVKYVLSYFRPNYPTSGGAALPGTGDEFVMDAATKAAVKEVVSDVVTRDVRPRGYTCSEHPNEKITVDWRLGSEDKAKIGFIEHGDGQIDSLEDNYQYVGDEPTQFKTLPHKGIETVLRLALGVDPLFTRKGAFGEFVTKIETERDK